MDRIGTALRTLPARLGLFVVLPLGLTVGAIGFFVLGRLERQFEQRMQGDVEMVARALQKPVSRALEMQRQGTLRNALESAIDIGRVYGAHLYDAEGQLLTSLGSGEDGDQSGMPRDLRHKPRGTGHYEETRGRPVYSYYVPVRLGGDRGSGLLRITRRKEEIDAFMRSLRWAATVVWTLLLIVTTAIVVLGTHGAAGASFARFRRSIDRVRSGEREHRAEERGPQELRSVVRAFNDMLDVTQDAERRIVREREERATLQGRLVASERLAAIGRLAAGIAHELGTPLSTVAGRAQRLLRRPGLPERTSKELREVRAEVQRMERLVREILDFGRRDALRTTNVAAQAILVSARATVERESGDASVTVHVSGGESVMLSVDPTRAERAVVNLLRNALAAARSCVRVSTHCLDDWAVIQVEDDGPGIPPEDREQVFEPFFTTRGPRGTGLGLAIVAAVAHEHGGEVQAETGDLGGARLTLSLPLGQDAAAANRAVRPVGGFAVDG